jgi:hypothetical protein
MGLAWFKSDIRKIGYNRFVSASLNSRVVVKGVELRKSDAFW